MAALRRCFRVQRSRPKCLTNSGGRRQIVAPVRTSNEGSQLQTPRSGDGHAHCQLIHPLREQVHVVGVIGNDSDDMSANFICGLLKTLAASVEQRPVAVVPK